MKLIPTTVFVEDLKYNEDTNSDTDEKFNKHITGKITIEFTSDGDLSCFLQQTHNTCRVVGLSDRIGYLLIDKDIDLNEL